MHVVNGRVIVQVQIEDEEEGVKREEGKNPLLKR